MVTLVTDYGSFDLPTYWDGTNGLDFRLPETVDGVAMLRFYAPAYALMLQAQDRAASAGAMGFAMRFTWDAGTSAADPGAGEARINHATAGSATAIYVNDADANGSSRTGVFALFDDGTSTVKGLVSLVKLTDPSAWLVGKLTATTDGAGFWTLTLTSVQASGATPFTAGDSVVLGFVPAGDRGWPVDGARWEYSTTTTDSDPGPGGFYLNHATQSSATQAYIDLVDADGVTQTAWLDAMDDASGTKKGRVRFSAQTDPTRYLVATVTAVTSASGYRKITFTVISSSSSNPLVNGEEVFITFQPAGDDGDVTGPASSTSNGIATWNGTGGAALLSTAWTVDATTGAMTAGGTFDMAGNAITIDFATFEQAGQHKADIDTSVSGEVILADTGAPYRAYTITGDTTLLVAGPTTPGYVSGGYRVVITQDGTGGRDVTILPANLLTYSEQFDNAAWTKTNASISADAVAAPDSRTTADKLVEDSSTGVHSVSRSVSVSAATAYIFDVFAEAAERTRLSLIDNGFAGAASGVFDLSNGTVVSQGANATASIVAAGGGIYRCRIAWTTSGAQSTAGLTARLVSSGTTVSYAGDGTSGLYLWGAQLVAGSSALGYAAVGATRAGMVTWPNADEPDWAAQAAGAVTEISLLPAYDGNIHAYKIRGG